MSSPIPPRDRLREVVRQLQGIGGGRSLGFGPNRVRSLPDGVAQAIHDYIGDKESVDVSVGESGVQKDQVRFGRSLPGMWRGRARK